MGYRRRRKGNGYSTLRTFLVKPKLQEVTDFICHLSFWIGVAVGFLECKINKLLQYAGGCAPDDLVLIFEEAGLAGNTLGATFFLPVVAFVRQRR